MSPPRIFLSYTHRAEIDQKAATAFLVEFRRAGLDVWIDREHTPPPATEEEISAGPTPENPLFAHIVSALADCDAVLYIASPTSLQREYVRLEHDPRVLFQSFREKHPDITLDNLPFWVAIVNPIPNPPPFWPILIDNIAPGRILNLTGAGSTPLILPIVLTNIIRDIDPEYLLPLNPVSEFVARSVLEDKADQAPGCPSGVSAKIWRRFEGYFGLGPLFPGPLLPNPAIQDSQKDRLSEDQLHYGLYRIGDTARTVSGYRPEMVDHMLALWSANIMLRSNSLRIQNGIDLPLYSLWRLRERVKVKKDKHKELFFAISLQVGYALVTSQKQTLEISAREILNECINNFATINASPLVALAQLLLSRADAERPPEDVVNIIKNVGCDYQDPDSRYLYHKILDSAFPGPRIEASREYRSAVRSLQSFFQKNSQNLKTGFAKTGQDKFNSQFWERV